MADYVPVNGFEQGDTATFTAGATITGGQVLIFSDVDTVSPSSAASQLFAGVAAHDAASSAPVTVYMGSGLIHETATTSTTTAVGNLIASATAGKITPGATAGQEIGVAVRAITATTGGTLRWKTTRG